MIGFFYIFWCKTRASRHKTVQFIKTRFKSVGCDNRGCVSQMRGFYTDNTFSARVVHGGSLKAASEGSVGVPLELYCVEM